MEDMNFHRVNDYEDLSKRRSIWVNGTVIVGAGPSGIATAACLKEQGVPFVVLERQEYIASLWQKRTHDKLKLLLPKHFYQLPNMPFPQDFPEYPTIRQYIDYLESYAEHFEINPRFNECVQSAKYDRSRELWRVKSISNTGSNRSEIEYICRRLVVASGENAECVMPNIDGLAEFRGEVIHACEYKSGEKFRDQKVLVVGCGNSGMEISLDLCNHNASPFIVVRSSVHVLPRDICGKSTFELAVLLVMWLPMWLVDKLLLMLSWLVLGNIERYGLKRPSIGPLELKNTMGKTPVLDIGAFEKIRSGDIKVVPSRIKKFRRGEVELVNGEILDIDCVVLATGYRSNVPSWLKEDYSGEYFSKNGFPETPFPNGWKIKGGLYAAGFTMRGLSGASSDAVRIANDISEIWKEKTKQKFYIPVAKAYVPSRSRIKNTILKKALRCL